MMKTLKKAISWYLLQVAKYDVCIPSCTVPMKYLMLKNDDEVKSI